MKSFKMIAAVIAFIAGSFTVSAQKVYTKNGSISFFSKAPLENISADNNQVMSVLNQQTGELQFSVIIKSFKFKKALMEEHFNENYMESEKYPKASFKGNIGDLSKVNFAKDGSYNVTVSGDLTMHGVTNKVSAPGTISVKNGVASAISKFTLKLADYKISIPKLVKDNISETVEVTVNCDYNQKL
jgi:polyisoprenoid-binding protein YceI